jgi:hypothetical protein
MKPKEETKSLIKGGARTEKDRWGEREREKKKGHRGGIIYSYEMN